MKSTFLKDILSVFSSRVLVILFGIGGTMLTARYLGPVGDGIIAAIMVYPTLFMSIGSLGIRQSTTYFVGQEKYDIKELYGAVLAILLFTSVFCIVFCYLFIHFFTKGNYSNTLIFLGVIGIPFTLYTTYSSGIFLGKQDVKEFNRINWIPACINFVITFILVVIFPFGIEGSMIGTFSGTFLFSFVVAIKMKKMISLKPIFNGKIIKSMLSLGLVYAVSLLVTGLNYKIDVVLLEKYSTAYEIGIYTKGAGLVEYLWQIPMLLSTIIFSRSAAAKDSKAFSLKVCRLLRFACLATLIACIGLYVMSGLVISILYGEKFHGSIMVLKILMPGVFLMTIFKVLNMDIAGRGKPWLAMHAMIPSVILNVILNYLWIPQYGASGSSMASTISYTLSAVIFLVIYARETNLSYREILFFDDEDKQLVLKYLIKLRLSKHK